MIKLKNILYPIWLLILTILILYILIVQDKLINKMETLEKTKDKQAIIMFKQAGIVAFNTVVIKHLFLLNKNKIKKKKKLELKLKEFPPLKKGEKSE